MKNRVPYGALLILLMGCCVFLSPTTRVLFFAVAGGLCAWEYSTQMERTGVSVSFCVLAFYLILQSVLVLTDAGSLLLARLLSAAIIWRSSQESYLRKAEAVEHWIRSRVLPIPVCSLA